MAYHNRWNANDQIPLRAVEEGLVVALRPDRLHRRRRDAALQPLRHVAPTSARTRRSEVQLYGIYSDLTSSRTSPTSSTTRCAATSSSRPTVARSSAARARTRRRLDALGADAHAERSACRRAPTSSAGSACITPRRGDALATVREDHVRETGTGLFAEAESRWTPLVPQRGRRCAATRYTFDVTSDRAGELRATRGGDREPEGVAGLRAVDADGALRERRVRLPQQRRARHDDHASTRRRGERGRRVDPLVRSRGAEIGLRATPSAGCARPCRSGCSTWTASCCSPATRARRSRPPRAAARRDVRELLPPGPVARRSTPTCRSRTRACRRRAAGEPHSGRARERRRRRGHVAARRRRGASASLRVRHFGSYPLDRRQRGARRSRRRCQCRRGLSAAVGHARAGQRANLLNGNGGRHPVLLRLAAARRERAAAWTTCTSTPSSLDNSGSRSGS